MTKEIVLNCMPPFDIVSPSPAMSVLKTYLCKYDYNVKIIYWNILLRNLENEFIWNKNEDSTILYAAYLAVQTNNTVAYNDVKTVLQAMVPIMMNEKNFFDDHIKEYVAKLDQIITNYLNEININNIVYFGFSMKMDQWIVASVIAEKIKQRWPHISIVVGGINTEKVAKAFLQNFNQFDVAVWGEGEIPLLQLTQFLLTSNDFSKLTIDRAYYRVNNSIKKSSNHKSIFIDLSDITDFPDVSDYFYFKEQTNITTPTVLFVEGGRGCHWNKCHFCYLNNGYKYRQKSTEKIVQEITERITIYGIYQFQFTDNDIIGKDMNRFYALLDELIKIKKKYPDLNITAEIISFDLCFKIIQKMAEAGINIMQIGLESVSNNLLKKIDKRNTFTSNLNAIKHSLDVGIKITGANIIRSLLEETEEDVCESIENLRFFRFLIKTNVFYLNPITLLINSSSKYFSTIINKRDDYKPYAQPYHKPFLDRFDKNTQWHLFEFFPTKKDFKWDFFLEVHSHYLKNKYEYKFIYEYNKIVYQEKFNNELSEQIEFNNDDIAILKYCYDKPISISSLQNSLSTNAIACSEKVLKEKINFLFAKGLVYRTPDYNEIVSIVKT